MTISNKKNAIRNFWASYPMTYGYEHGATSYTDADGNQVNVDLGSKLFFELADKTFYNWNLAEHNEKGYFGRIFDYDRYVGKPVLEVGCGMGCMAMNWAIHGAAVTAVDLNPVAIVQTKNRFHQFGLQAEIREADAENLPFEDAAYDYVYSWGVLHHTPNTAQTIQEIYRILKPGGRTGVMLYHRDSIMYRFLTAYIEGFIHLENKFLSPVELGSRYGDGERVEGNPHTWPVTKREVRENLFKQFSNVKIYVLGTELTGIFNQWFPSLGSKMPKSLLKACIRRWGWSLWITGEKPGAY
jgi:ubiquinone/menaquinone biosynthesis C-methylase UbiE